MSELNFNQRYEAMRGTPTPPPAAAVEAVEAPVVVELPAGEAPKPEAGAPPPADKPREAEPAAGTPAPAPQQTKPPQGGFQKQIADRDQEIADLRRKLQERPNGTPAAAAPPAANGTSKTAPAAAAGEDPEPKVEDFEDYAEYLKATSRWGVREELRENTKRDAIATTQAKVRERLDAAAAKYPDFHEVAQRQIPVNEATKAFLGESEHAGDLFYYLGTHTDEAAQIAAMSPMASARALVKLENQFSVSSDPATGAAHAAAPAPLPATPVQSKAPKPPTSVRSSSVAPETTLDDVAKLPEGQRMKAFTELRAKHGQRDAKRLVATR